MRTTRAVLLFLAASLTLAAAVALGGDQTGLNLMKELRQKLDLARALPRGAKPTRPDYDLSLLTGLGKPEVERVLGLPSYCGHDDSWSDIGSDCHEASPWQYRWGPLAPATDSAGPGKIVVTAGGPWLLVLDFSSDAISAAHWLDQR